MPNAPVVADLTWLSDLKFATTVQDVSLVFDSAGIAGISPIASLVAGLAGCMAMDVVFVLTRGHHPLTGLRAHIVAHRAEQAPKRLVNVELRFTVSGAVPDEPITRAIELSREKYCSVWHSLRQDIPLHLTWDRAPSA